MHRAVADDVFDGVFFVLSFFPRDVLDEIWDLIESVYEGFPSCSCNECVFTSCPGGNVFFSYLLCILSSIYFLIYYTLQSDGN